MIINSLIKKWGYKKNWRLDNSSNPHESNLLMLNCDKAKKNLGWENKVTLEELIAEMVSHDLNETQKEVILNKKGYFQNNPLETIPDIMN